MGSIWLVIPRRWGGADCSGRGRREVAGLADIPVIVRELSDSQAVAVALIENIQCEDLTPVEEAGRCSG